jgi:putative beta-lysine N-acetyltransferase
MHETTEPTLELGGSPSELIEDLKPVPVKNRSSLGIVELTLDHGQSVKAVGVVYGIEHSISGEGYEATLFLDQYSQRIKIVDYQATDIEAMILKVRFLAEANGFDKIICMARQRDWQIFLRFGYVLEAVLKYYRGGEDAFVVSKFRSQERLTSHNLMEEILMIEKVMAQRRAPHEPRPPPTGHEIRLAKRDDIPELIELYNSIFDTYPSPLIHPGYLETIFQKEAVFAVCTRAGEIVSAASAEKHPPLRAAELTDCATKTSARGLGLMSHLLALLESTIAQKGYICAYTMARSRSYGMNNVFYRLGYEFMGRLINNCDIYGDYEDMNIWVKDLRADPRDSARAAGPEPGSAA